MKNVAYDWKQHTDYGALIRDLVHFKRVSTKDGRRVSPRLLKLYKAGMTRKAFADFNSSVERGRAAMVSGWELSKIDMPCVTVPIQLPSDSLAHLRYTGGDGSTCIYCLHALNYR